MKETMILVDGIEIKIEMSKHAEDMCEERGLTEYEAYSMIIKLGEDLLTLKNGEEFSVIDRELNNAVICSMNSRDFNCVIDIITVISNSRVWISRGTKVYKLNDIDFTVIN